jgi:hypothetical protein
MFIIDRSGANCLCVWDGHSARVEQNVATPKSSSSVDARHVKTLRKQLFADLELSSSTESARYLQYHASHLPSKSKESVCMHREDANTVSLSHVSVDAQRVAFAYADGAPCTAELQAPVSIELLPFSEISMSGDKAVVARI